jgi:endoglucanase
MQSQLRAARAVRNIDTNVPVIVESGDWDRAAEYSSFQPLPLKHIIYEAHMYDPHQFTHQGIESQFSDIQYPGLIDGKLYNKETLRHLLQPLRNFQLTHNAHVYIGEFSAVRWAPGAATYLNDCISIFEEYGWDWTYHAFREADVWNVEVENRPGGKSKETVVSAATSTDRKKVLLSWLKRNKNFD